MSDPRASCVRVCKTGIMIGMRDHLVFPCTSKLLAPLVLPSRDGSDDLAIREGLQRIGSSKEENDKDILVLRRLNRIVGRAIAVPPPIPMVSLVRSYVRAA